MKIAFTSTGKEMSSKIDARFGRTDYILVLDDSTKNIDIIDNTAIANEAHGAGPKTAQKIFEVKADVIITGNGPGGNALTVLKKSATKIYIGAGDMSVEEAYQKYLENKLSEM